MPQATGVILSVRRATDKLEIADDNDLHSSDTVQEKLSLVYRFGVRIYFGSTGQKSSSRISSAALADRYGVTMPEEELLLKANQWELSHGGLTGRTAQQFIDYICWEQRKKRRNESTCVSGERMKKLWR